MCFTGKMDHAATKSVPLVPLYRTGPRSGCTWTIANLPGRPHDTGHVQDVAWSLDVPRRVLNAALVLIAVSLFPPAAKAADFCAEAWVVRNMIFDRLGYCFGSRTGQMLFDNGDCRGKNVNPDPRQAETVAFIREGETHVGCKINTSKPPSADMRAVHAFFSQFIDLPAPDYVGGYACWGYRGPAFELRAGASATAPLIGTAQTGQSVVTTYFSHYPGWQFYDIVTGPNGGTILSGWATGIDIGDAHCDSVAG